MSETKWTEADLCEAEAALDASIQATRTHGHSGITWSRYAAAAKRVKQIRAALAAARGETT